MNRSLLKAFISGSLAFSPAFAVLLAPAEAEAAPPASSSSTGMINGTVKNQTNGEAIENALVILQCNCLTGKLESTTNARGIYSFRDLPQGDYTVQVLVGKANVSKITSLPRGAAFRANFSINPQSDIVKRIVVESSPVATNTTSTVLKVDMEQAKSLPVGADTSRDFTAVVDLTPTASRDAAGISLGGTSGAESKYTVEGADVTSPASGTVGATIIQEFIESVEVLESGYEAEYGGASGGQVSARRVSGTNKLRGEAGVRFSPRLAEPRFISSTDEALRVTQVADYQAQAYAVVSGPIKKDKLFFTIGIVPTGTQFSLVQSFYNRIDRDGSGGYEECPYENGNNDCVEGGNYIASEKFAEQEFRTGAFSFGYIAGLDWVVRPNHRLRLTGTGGPSFLRTTYRLPFAFDPNAFGTNPASDPLGGTSRIATGIVNEHFGTTLAHTTTVALGYEGRLLDGKMEIDANVSYFRSVFEDAWRLDDPSLKNLPATQEQDTQGRNLFEFLDRDGAVDLVPGVDEACNASGLPGLACPTRTWLSGGIGEYDRDVQQRIAGDVKLTHFFNAAGAHQLKYGGGVNWLQRHSTFTYSGHNEADFYNNCAAGQSGGGEWCYDPEDNAYSFNNTIRVNNHRFTVVDTDNPDSRFTRGFGRVRHEQNDLRAMADSLGRGVRVDSYDETLSTFNYGAFLQDKWSILSNLYISAGVRWEVQDMRDIFGDSQITIWDNVAPRVGLVYDWTDEGKSRLYASYGWFYQPLPLALNSRVFGGLVQVGRTYRNSDCVGQFTVVDGQSNPRVVDGQPTEWCVDNSSFTTGLTTGSIVPRLKGNYNQQFQVGYEQEVIEDLVIGFRWLHTDLGRAVEDVSTNGGLNFIIANPGVEVAQSDIDSQRAECDQLQADFDMAEMEDPTNDENNVIARELQQCNFLVDAFEQINQTFDKPVRNYDAWTIELKKRFAKNWLLLASYTYSRLVGNYDGFVDPVSGAINLGASTQYDIPELVRNSFGPLSGNIPHRAKLDGFYTFDLRSAGRLTLGTSVRFQSGFPISVRADNNRYQGAFLIYVIPRGAGGRVEPNYQWNLSLGYSYPLPKDLELDFSARVLNVTNARAVLRVDEIYSFQTTRPVAGGDLGDLKHTKIQSTGAPNEFFQGTIVAPQGNFGVETQFQQPLSAQFELKLRF